MIFQIYAFMYVWKETYQICKNMKVVLVSYKKIYGHPVAYKIWFLSNQKKLYAWRQDNTMPLKHKIFKLCPHIICFSTGFKEMLHVSP